MGNQSRQDERPTSFLTGSIDLLSRFSFLLSQICIVAILIIVFLSIMSRYFFNYVLEWSDEVVSYIFIFTVFFGMAEVMREKGHISVDLFLSRLSKRKLLLTEIFIFMVSLGWCAVMGWQAWKVTQNAFKFGITSSTLLRFPLYISYSFLFVGLTLITLQILVQIGRTATCIMDVAFVQEKEPPPPPSPSS